uniref:Putative secreted protein n=1 Tax=Ixodes ricinus TaxID=34613 RepID=A0A6B0U3U0_IXORI
MFFFFSWIFFSLKNSSRSLSSSSELMYCRVRSMRGMITCSMALTRLLVILMTLSRVMKDVCREASSTSSFTASK